MSSWGGAREGAGRKPDDYVPPPERGALDRLRAEHEAVKMAQRQFKLEQEQGLWVSRAEVSQASSAAMSIFTQAALSLPANLERRCNLTPVQVAAAQEQVDAMLSELAAAMRALAGQ